MGAALGDCIRLLPRVPSTPQWVKAAWRMRLSPIGKSLRADHIGSNRSDEGVLRLDSSSQTGVMQCWCIFFYACAAAAAAAAPKFLRNQDAVLDQGKRLGGEARGHIVVVGGACSP